MNEPTTSADCLKAAFAATLKGDYAERDRLCNRAKTLLEAEHYAGAVERVMAVDFFVTRHGIAIPTPAMARAANAIQ